MIWDVDGNHINKSKLLTDIQSEGTHRGEFEIETKTSEKLKFNGGFTAILNANNVPQKIVCILH
jgi:hypothetical protein